MVKESYKCAFCDKEMSSSEEVFGMGVKLKEGLDYPSEVGRMTLVELPVQDKTYECMVTADNSRAKMEGWDLVFMVCSEKCGGELRGILATEEDLFEEIM